MSDRLSIAFQGTKSGLVIAIDDTLSFQAMMSELSKKLSESGDFFANAEVTLNLGARALTEVDLKQILKTVQQTHDLKIAGVKTDSQETAATAELLGLSRMSAAQPASEATARRNGLPALGRKSDIETLPAELIRKTLRSGQIYESRKTVVILGDVNAGAEVISAGDIVVFGALRGVAHAGATGNQQAIIVSWKLRPMQLRIANRIARSDGQQTRHDGAEYAFIDGDQIVIDKWTNASTRAFLNE